MNYNEIISKMTALVELAKKEDRSFTEAEQKEYDGLSQMAKAKLAMKENGEVLKQLANSSNTIVEERAVPTPQITVGKEHDVAKEYRSAFLKNLIGVKLNKQEERVLTVGTPANGGNLVPTDFLAELENRVRHQNPFMSLPGVDIKNLVRGTQFPLHINLATAAVKAEGNDVSGSITQASFGTVTLTPFNVYSEMVYTRELRLQSAVEIENFILRELSRAIAEKQHQLIVAGAGTTEPLGLSKMATVAGVSIPRVEQGTGNSGTITVDNLLALYAALEDARGVVDGAVWVMHHSTYRAIINILEEVETAVGTPADTYSRVSNKRLFLPDMRAGLNGQIFGLNVVKSKYMPSLSADNAVSIALMVPEAMSIANFGGREVVRPDGDLTLAREGKEAIVAYDSLDMKINSLDSVVLFNNEDTA